MARSMKLGWQVTWGILASFGCGLLALPAFADVRFAAHVHGGFVGPYVHVHPHCVTDWYGGFPPATGFDSSFFFSPMGGYYRAGFSSARYSAWGWAPVYGPRVISQTTIVPVSAGVVVVDPQPVVVRSRRPIVGSPPPDGPNMFDVLQQHAERRENVPIEKDADVVAKPVSSSSKAGKQRSIAFQTEGDRWLREGQFVKAYLRYLEAQREAEDRAEVYFRQAFTLVAMGRYSHAVLKLKRGLQVDPTWPKHPDTLDRVYGPGNALEKSEFLQRAADWTNEDVRSPDRLFLMGVLLFSNGDDRADDFFQAAWKLTRRGDHLLAFLKSTDASRGDATVPAKGARELPPPPPPQEDPAANADTNIPFRQERLEASKSPRGPKPPALDVPPAPEPRELILPDVLDR